MLRLWHKAVMLTRNRLFVFVDYAKAFDHVDHGTVMTTLAALGVPPLITRRLCSFVSDRQQRVKIDNVFFERASQHGGMPEGTWLAVYIFLI